jgi:hypothetical protein
VRAAALGLDARAVRELTGRARTPQLDRLTWQRARDELAGPDGLTLRRPTFSRREVLQELCERLPVGARLDAGLLERAADGVLGSSRVVALLPDQPAERGESFPTPRRTTRAGAAQRSPLLDR